MEEGTSYLFVKIAVALHDMEVSEEHVDFTQETWNACVQKIKNIFQSRKL